MAYKNSQSCCTKLEQFLGNQNIPLYYYPTWRMHYLKMTSRGVIQGILFCPWCGKKLPKDIGDEYYDILQKEYGIEPDLDMDKNPAVPKEFKSDVWWRKRGL